MGLFLHTALLPRCGEAEARRAVDACAELSVGLVPEACRYQEFAAGTAVWCNEGCSGYEELALALSANLAGPALLLYIYDDDFWGYYLCADGRTVDQFCPLPSYFADVSEAERRRFSGDAKAVARCFSVEPGTVLGYLRFWEGENFCRKARPGDRYPAGDCWQMADFMAALGFPCDAGREPELPLYPGPALSLEEILAYRPPVPARQSIDDICPLSDLPSVLDGDYIRTILSEETIQCLLLLGTAHPENAYNALARMQNATRPAPHLCFLLAYCAYWTGSFGFAYTELYRALLPSLFPAYRNDALLTAEETVLLLRGRSLVVPEVSKRHIACKDLTRLLELDPENGDVYLLVRCYFRYLDSQWAGSLQPAREDLKALSQRPQRSGGIPVLWEAFPEAFLRFVRRGGS